MSHPKGISAIPEACSGCLRCALACSFFTSHKREFSLTSSKIQVIPSADSSGFEIVFTEDCNKCGICIHHCEFGALGELQEV